jgi:hypothetical protein
MKQITGSKLFTFGNSAYGKEKLLGKPDIQKREVLILILALKRYLHCFKETVSA